MAKNKQTQPIKEAPISMSLVRKQWDELFAISDRQKVLGALGYAYNNNPYIQNDRAKGISTRPFTKDRSDVEKALQNIATSEQTLRQVSQSLRSNYSVVKLNNLYADILTYRWYFNTSGKINKIDKRAYENERRKVYSWCEKFQPARTFRKVVLATQWEGKTVWYSRQGLSADGSQVAYAYLQQLPSDYVKIVGWNTASGYTVSFDFTYFWQAGASPLQFPPIFSEYFRELNETIPPELRGGNGVINPTSMPTRDGVDIYYSDNQWYYWKTLPMDECWVFSQDESTAYQTPNMIGLFLQAQDLQDYSYLQQELLQLPLSGAVFGSLPMVKDSNGTTSTDNYAVGTEAFTFFTEMFNAVAPNGMQLFLSPATGYQFFRFDGDTVNNSQVYSNAIKQFNTTAGIAALTSTTDKPNLSQVKTSQIMEAAYVEKMYDQFINFVNTTWEHKLRLKLNWRFHIKGSQFKDTTDFARVEKGLAMGQNYLLPEYLSYFDLRLDDVSNIQIEVGKSGVYSRFSLLPTSYTQSSSASESVVSDKKNGRPQISENEVESDGTANSIENGANTSEGREFGLTYCVECGEPLGANAYKGCFCSEECYQSNQERLGDY